MADNPEIQCPVGCGLFDAPGFSDHLMSDPATHITWLMGEISTLRKENISLNARILALERIPQQCSDEPDIARHIQQVVDVRYCRMQQVIAEFTKTMDVKAGVFEDSVTVLHMEISRIITALENLEQQRRIEKENLESVKEHAKKLEKMVAIKDTAISELNLKIQSLESSSYNGTFIWKIADFTKKQHDASQSTNISIYSPAFYTSHCGYKACACLYPDGDGMGKGTHLSLFFVVMRGEYDALQQWPFKQKVTFCLVNQYGGEHILDSFRPDPSSPSFKRPTTDMNIATGCPLFIRIGNVTDPNNGYLMDDTLFIKVTVDVSDL